MKENVIKIEKNVSPALELVIAERLHQIVDLKHTIDKDKKLDKSELLYFAQYCMFSNEQNKPKTQIWSKDYLSSLHYKSRIDQLVIGAAVLIAEIDRRLMLLENKDSTIESTEEV